MKHKVLFSLLAALPALLPHSAQAQATKPLRVLTISGDWKSQPWYQDVWMQGKGTEGKGTNVKYRGRFIAQEVERAAPGRFQFTDITNATGQQYGDQLFRNYDVVVMGDVVGWSLPPRFQTALRDYVRGGGGLVYAASYKWSTALMKNTPFEEALPATFPVSGLTDDWKAAELQIKDKDFKAQVAPGQNAQPVVAGLDFASIPTLDAGFLINPKPGSQVLLRSPQGAPILVAEDFGRGRSVVSSSIWANDELSTKIGGWKDFGRYYAQLLSWTGAHSVRRAAPVMAAPATVSVRVNAAGAGTNTISAKYFGIHAAHDDPGLAPLQGEALKNFEALNLKGAFTRFSPQDQVEPENDDDDPNHFNLAKFNFKNLDEQMVQINRLNLEPILLVNDFFGTPAWMFADGSSWSNPSDKAIAEAGEHAAAMVEHLNGKGGTPGYKLSLRYLEIANEPDLQGKTLPGFVRLFKGVARRIHRDYPGVQVGTFGGYEIPYLNQFLDQVNPDCDWISRHPYGWTGEMVMAQQDAAAAYMKQKGLRQIPFIITEWDFWIQGREKFDYMMRRNFETVKRTNLLGTLHYRLGQYGEPIYLFGVLWTGYGQDRGAGDKGTPMHDAYDAFYLWRDFRGQRVPVSLNRFVPTNPGAIINLPEPLHVLADAARDGDKVSAVLYNDWAATAPANVRLQLDLPPSNRVRTLTVTRATGEGFQTVGQPTTIPAGTKTLSRALEIAPNTGMSVSVQ